MLKVTNNSITNDSPWVISGSSKARLVNATPNLDETVGYVARVSSKAQENPSVEKLLGYCAKHGHWSVFEQGSLTVEVVTPLAISIQALRHRSFCFQQFSGRYQDQREMAAVSEDLPSFLSMFYIPEEAREQDPKNRQNSIFSDNPALTDVMWREMEFAYQAAIKSYDKLIEEGVAKEIARFVLPQGVFTRLYITGNPRSFIHYCNVRDEEGVVQWEHVELARAIRGVFSQACPIISKAVWPNSPS
jgi:thymidylate synthase (FAD)